MVTEEWVMGQASDSYFNHADYLLCNECGKPCTTMGKCQHEGNATPVYYHNLVKPKTLREAIDWLQDTGEVTFAKGWWSEG